MLSFVAMGYFKSSPMMVYPLIALALFMLVFFVVTLRAVMTQKSHWEALQRLPLEESRSTVGGGHD